jgi:tetratricopeptide (TPR) repeat protein
MRRNTLGLVAGLVAGLMVSAAVPALAQATAAPVRANSFAGAYLAARTAETDGDYSNAISYYRRALDFEPDNRTVRQSLLLGLISSDRFDDALPHAEALKDVPEVERFSRLALAVDAVRKGEFADAEETLELTLESDLDRLIIGVFRAWMKLGQGEAQEALAALDSLAGPEWYNLFLAHHRGLIADVGGLTEEADTAYSATVSNVSAGAAAPEVLLRAMESYVSFLSRQGRTDDAIAVLDQAESFVSGRVTIEALREKVEAGEDIPPLLADEAAGASEILLNLATALNRGGGESFVRLYLQYALALQPQSDAILIQLAGIAEQQQRAEEAIGYYGRISADSPFKHVAELQLGLNLADLDRHEEAIEHLTALLDANPDDMRAYLALGGVYHSQENYAAGAELYDRAVERIDEPTRAEWNIYYQRGIAYERLKQWEKAEPNFRQALELFPDQPHVLNYLGYSWVDMNINLEEGLELIERAVELRPSDGYIVDSLGWAYYRLERFDDAVRELERAVNLMPNDPILNDHLGDAYWRVGRRLEAMFQWSHARDMEPDDDVLEAVERKLVEGLPTIEEERAAREAAERERALDDASNQAAPAEHQEASAAGIVAMPSVPEAIPAPAAAPSVHVVQPGQSLWSIAAQRLGDGNRYMELLDLNPGLRGDPGRLVPGQELQLP